MGKNKMAIKWGMRVVRSGRWAYALERLGGQRRYRPAGGQGMVIGLGRFLQELRILPGLVEGGAQIQGTVVLQDKTKTAVDDGLPDLAHQLGRTGKGVRDHIHGVADGHDHFVEKGRDRLVDQGENAGKGLVRVHHRPHIRAVLVDTGMHARFDGGFQAAGNRPQIEINHADILRHQVHIGSAGRCDHQKRFIGDAHGNVAAGASQRTEITVPAKPAATTDNRFSRVKIGIHDRSWVGCIGHWQVDSDAFHAIRSGLRLSVTRDRGRAHFRRPPLTDRPA
ncbi:hypothetical protein DESC_100050 [Desulfosarcina cetonica]|nr:hypothetical protein DESC_100050 [Desulfosarcina cetonica]